MEEGFIVTLISCHTTISIQAGTRLPGPHFPRRAGRAKRDEDYTHVQGVQSEAIPVKTKEVRPDVTRVLDNPCGVMMETSQIVCVAV